MSVKLNSHLQDSLQSSLWSLASVDLAYWQVLFTSCSPASTASRMASPVVAGYLTNHIDAVGDSSGLTPSACATWWLANPTRPSLRRERTAHTSGAGETTPSTTRQSAGTAATGNLKRRSVGRERSWHTMHSPRTPPVREPLGFA